ncbi:hypothetical protein [Ferrimonas sp. SCSIO 43195]|uniref:hypothetical protein n=1 Tax=Ferrimonas sp. SCSIO 43195 TaxID=2822844 RepID=UPI002074D24D|nr:hypothetical protein [Ferrimonas sp. SCSIO 43195]USD38339.1 hypothetical protein J8Z22_04105 [Ferrimonas sp. SCSIO 43195]
MKQFDKQILIPLSPTQPASLKAALERYQELLASEQAFRQEMGLMHNVEFVASQPQGHRRLQPDDAGKMERLLAYAMTCVRGGMPALVSDDDEVYFSEAILFAAALGHPELKPTLIATAEAMVAFARRRNDSSDMWLDDCHLFGLEALYMLAVEHDECAWLLAGFFIPYWDSEHEDSHDTLMALLVQACGWSRDLLNAYIYCDNPQVRRSFNQPDNHGDLADYLQQHPQEYQWFCDQLSQRLITRPLLAYHDEHSLDETQPVLGFFHTMRAEWPVAADPYDQDQWQDEVNLQPFLNGNIETAALALHQNIEQNANGPLVVVAEAHQDNGDDSSQGPLFDDQFGNALNFIGGLDQGPMLRAYVQGELDQDSGERLLAQVPEFDFGRIGRYEYGGAEAFQENLALWLSRPFAQDDVVPTFPYYFERLLSERRGVDNELRLLDLFWRLLGRPQFPRRMADTLIQEFGHLSETEYCDRYRQDLNSEQQQHQALHEDLECLWCDELELSEFAALDQRTRAHPSLLAPEQWPQTLGAATYAAWCAQDIAVADGAAGRMTAWLDQQLMPLLCQQLAEYSKDDTLPAELQLYLTDNEPQPFDPARHTQMAERLVAILHHDGGTLGDRITDRQPAYALLMHDDGFQFGLHCLFWLHIASWLDRVPLRLERLSQRLLQLLLTLAPQKVIGLLSKPHSDYPLYQGINDVEAEHTLHRQLSKCGVSDCELEVFRLCSDQQLACYRPADARFWQRYVAMLDHYGEARPDDSSMLGASAWNQYQQMLQVLRRREDRERLQFYQDLMSRHPEAVLPQWLEEEFTQALNGYLISNTEVEEDLDWLEQPARRRQIANDTAVEVLAYLNGDRERQQVQAKLAATLSRELNARTDAESRLGPQFYLWGLLDQDRSDRLLTLLLNHHVSALKLLAPEPLTDLYVAQLIRQGELPLEQRWQHPQVGHITIRDPQARKALIHRAAEWALQRLSTLDIPEGVRVAFAFQYQVDDYLKTIASQQALPPMSPYLCGKDRLALAERLGQLGHSRPGIKGLLQDTSVRVRALAQRLLDKE